MARRASEAERLRHHRRCFNYGLEHGLTPKDAELELARIDARESDREAMQRIERKKAIPLSAAAPFEAWEAPWMRRD